MKYYLFGYWFIPISMHSVQFQRFKKFLFWIQHQTQFKCGEYLLCSDIALRYCCAVKWRTEYVWPKQKYVTQSGRQKHRQDCGCKAFTHSRQVVFFFFLASSPASVSVRFLLTLFGFHRLSKCSQLHSIGNSLVSVFFFFSFFLSLVCKISSLLFDSEKSRSNWYAYRFTINTSYTRALQNETENCSV